MGHPICTTHIFWPKLNYSEETDKNYFGGGIITPSVNVAELWELIVF
jgi:hypothetical protein